MKLTRHKNPLWAKPWLAFVTIWFLVGAIGIYFRLYPLRTYASHTATEKASLWVVNNIRQKVNAAVGNLSDLPPEQKKAFIDQQVNQILHRDADKVRAAIHEVAQKIDAEADTRRTPHLLASDSFYYYRLTRKIVTDGSISQNFKGSKYFNELMLAPSGHWEPLNLHPYLGYLVYRVLSPFMPDIPLMQAVSFTPILVMLAALAAFLVICFQLGCGRLVSALGALHLVLAPIFLKRSTFGWYDNDPYNIFFPLLILAIFFFGLRHRDRRRQIIYAACLCFLSIVIYALFWHGWMFLASVIIVSALMIGGLEKFVFKRGQSAQNISITAGILLIGILAGIALVFGWREFFILFKEGWSAVNDFFKPQISLWPNLYIGVGELHQTSLGDILDLTGGYPVFSLALLGLIGHGWLFQRGRLRERLYPVLILSMLFVLSLLMALQAERFTLLFLSPLILCFTLGMALLWDFFKQGLPAFNSDRPKAVILYLAATLMTLGLVVLPVKTAAYKLPHLLNKIYNDTWHTVLSNIRAETPPSSIINTWWSPGHFITAIAQRRVTFDGASINKPQAYWMARVLMSQNEKSALAILRMLNNAGNRPVEYLQENGLSLSQAVTLLNEIVVLTPKQAQQRLQQVLDAESAGPLRALIFRDPPPAYLLIYNELIEKNIQLSFVANWDFQKIEQLAADPVLRQGLLSGSQEYVRKVWQIEGGMPRFSGMMTATLENENQIEFARHLKIGLKEMRCRIDSEQYGHGVPFSLIYLEGDRIVEKKYPKPDLSYSVILFRQAGRYHCALMDTPLARSLLMRLYCFEGRGFHFIKPFMNASDLTRRTQLYVFEVDWNKFKIATGAQ